MQIQKLILIVFISGTVFAAEEEPGCMDKGQYLATGLKLTEHLLYAVEHVNKGQSIDKICAQKWREKYYEKDMEEFRVPLIQAREDLDKRKITSSENFPYIRRNKKEMIRMQQVCQMVDVHLKTNNRCMEPEGYMRTLITKKIIARSFEENCSVYLPAVVANVENCKKK